VQFIVPGPYTAPSSVRAARRFAQVAAAPPAVPDGLGALGGRAHGPRWPAVVLIGAALVAAGGVGTAVAMRLAGLRARSGIAAPTMTAPAAAVPSPLAPVAPATTDAQKP
jgi:hypothetical protein